MTTKPKVYHRNRNGEYARMGVIARIKRFIFRKIIIPTLVLGIPAAGYLVYDWSDTRLTFLREHGVTPIVSAGDTSEAAEIIARRLLTERLIDIQNDVLAQLAKCESGGITEPEAAIILDSNNRMSIGKYMWQVTSVQRYVEKYYGQKVDRKTATLIAMDAWPTIPIADLTRTVLFEEGNQAADWKNCATRLGLPEQIRLINKLTN